MVEISAQLVKELRDKTGAGMGECKKSLTESNGDINQAIEILRKKGASMAAKRADRSAKEGIILAKTSSDGRIGIILEVNCETDFVARNEQFIDFVNIVGKSILNNDVNDIDTLMNTKIETDSIKDLHNEILAKFSENIQIRRFEKIKTNGYIAEYIHAGSRLAVLVEVSANDLNQQAKTLLRDIAMQIAAMKPEYISRIQVPNDTLQKEIEIYKQQAIEEGKKPEIAERIATGRLEKFYQEQCLIEQTFVKDSNKIVKNVLDEISNEFCSEVKINSFRRYFLGEEL